MSCSDGRNALQSRSLRSIARAEDCRLCESTAEAIYLHMVSILDILEIGRTDIVLWISSNITVGDIY